MPAMSNPLRDVETATEQLCPPKFRALNAPKYLTWTLETGAKNKKQMLIVWHHRSNWFKWKHVTKNEFLEEILTESLNLPEFY